MTSQFRPWGQLSWILPKLGPEDWSFLGVLGTEDRCSAAFSSCMGHIDSRRFLKILDPHLSPRSAFDARFEANRQQLMALGCKGEDFRSVDLLQDIDGIEDEISDFLNQCGSRLILDLSSMPKRWFFPILRVILTGSSVQTLIVTYSAAGSYGEQLSSDPAPLAPIPTFDEPRDSEKYDELVIGVGFAPLGLRDLFEVEIGKIRYFFPFPPGPPNFHRNWDFLRMLETEVENRKLRAEDRWQIHTFDVPSTFEALKRVTNDGGRSSALAPFGPKTMSLAMCLFALAADRAKKAPVHVYYSQPRRYAIDYSTGIGMLNGFMDVKAYCVRIDGRDLYTL